MAEPDVESKPEPLRTFLFVTTAVLTLVCAYGFLVWRGLPDWTQRGQFGDMFGGANTLFSGLAFAALSYALLLQRKELNLQRIELALTRAELTKQSEAQTQQARTALRAARISALGSLLQAYGQFAANRDHGLIARTGWPEEIERVRNDLLRMLAEEDA